MSTKRVSDVLSEDYITNFKRDTLLCEKVEMEMRDGTLIPVVMVYDRRFYTEESPWVLFTQGIDSQKSDLQLSPHKLSLTDRGIVLAYPLIRGTHYFDSDWLLSGTGERKITHFNDLIDTAIFIKENELAAKVAVQGSNSSGALTALASTFKEPYLFEGVAVHNPLTDLPSHLINDLGKRLAKQSPLALQNERVKLAKLTEFGNIAASQSTYERVLSYSPYHIPLLMNTNRPISDILITCDEDSPYKYHSRKLISKIREASMMDPMYTFYHEFPT